MRTLQIVPDGWPCTLEECPPGFFIVGEDLCFKTEYHTEKGESEAYCHTGEYFVGGAASSEARAALVVQPVAAEWVDV